jgi:hypothetical protein
MDFGEIGLGGVDSIDRSQYKGSCECGNEPSGSINGWEVLE